MTLKPESVTTTKKKAYKTPSLAKYGQLKDLTTGGTKKGQENGNNGKRT